MNFRAFLVTIAFVASAAHAQDPQTFARVVKPFMEAHCLDCHDSSEQKGGLNLEGLKPSFATNEDTALWTLIFDRMEHGEMPPPKKPRPPAAAQKAVMQFAGLNIYAAETKRHATEGRSAWRRMNRVEYENTVRDLLLIDAELKEFLPEDGLANGFSNVDVALDVSAIHLEKYLEAADAALDAVLKIGKKPESKLQRFPFTEMPSFALPKTPPVAPQVQQIRHTADAVILTSETYPPKVISWRPSAPGRYKFRLSLSADKSDTPLAVFITTGTHFHAGGTKLTQAFDVSPGKPQVREWIEKLPTNHTLRLIPDGANRPRTVDAMTYEGPGVALYWVEIEGPLVETWPPASYQRLLGGIDLAKGTFNDAQTILRSFLPRAFRRDVGEAEMQPYLGLVKAKLDAGGTFEQALRLALRAALVSPDFLYFQSKPGPLDDYALASRLSYFLWSTMPDEALLALAKKKQLAQPAALRAQVERMLADPKAQALTENFTAHWLKLREMEATNPDPQLYPEFGMPLQWSMPRETHAFFDELLKNDLSLLNFVHSDFAMLNGRMAAHYGIPGVHGLGFQKVALKPEWHRGGVITQAAILKVTANGTNTSPVPRGVFFLDNILGRPVPPPPKNTPAIEPDTRGAMTIRAQLEKHRNVEMCMNCHQRIDPAGGTLEAYDVIGQWRDNYRITATPKNREKGKAYGIGPAVETDVTLPGGKKLANIDEFKKFYLADPASRDQFARALAEKLLIYGTGHELDFADRAVVSQIVNAVRAKNYGLRSLVHAVVQSPTFLNK